MITSLLQGLAIGFSVNAPIGPIGVFCIRRTIADGLVAGLLAGLGAAVADGIFGIISALAVHRVASILHHAQFYLALIGGLLLLVFAVWTLLRPPAGVPQNAQTKNRRQSIKTAIISFFMSLGFTIINPLTILLFAAIFTGIDPRATLATMLWIVLGMFISAVVCWTVLVFLTHFVRLRLNKSMMTAVNALSAAAFAGYGIWAIVSAFYHS